MVAAGELIEKALVGLGDHRVRKRGEVFIELDVSFKLSDLSPGAIDLAQSLIAWAATVFPDGLRLGYG
jgi:hypothetical protein